MLNVMLRLQIRELYIFAYKFGVKRNIIVNIEELCILYMRGSRCIDYDISCNIIGVYSTLSN